MSKRNELIVEASVDGYVARLGLSRKTFETAQLSTETNPRMQSAIGAYRNQICMQARQALRAVGRPNKFLGWDKLTLEVVRDLQVEAAKAIEAEVQAATLAELDAESTFFDTKPVPVGTNPCGCVP